MHNSILARKICPVKVNTIEEPLFELNGFNKDTC